MKARTILALVAFAISLLALALHAMQLHIAIDAFSPLDPKAFGPHTPAVTAMTITQLPSYPLYMAGLGVASSAVALYFWLRRSPEARAFALVLLAAINFYHAGVFQGVFLTHYFVVPKMANDALSASP